MKLTEFLEKIVDAVSDYEESGVDPEDVEVLLAIQPGYPLTMAVAGMATSHEVDDYKVAEKGADAPGVASETVFWIAASDGPGSYDRSPYAPRAIWEIL